MAEIPNLAGKATDDLVEKIGGGKFQASYINWSRTVNLLREHAPGWMPELVTNEHGSVIHRAPVGAYLLIRFRHTDGTVTPEVPQAIMDNNNKSIPLDRIDARDITDTHRRGVCMAAAFTFGLAYELWAKMPLESGFAENPKPEAEVTRITPNGGVWESLDDEQQAFLQKIADAVLDLMPDADAANAHIASQQLEADEKVALWSRLDSKTRTALKKAHKEAA